MELLKIRTVPDELRALRILNASMELSPKEKNHYLNFEKGYQGEVMFDELTVKLQGNMYVINDLCLEYNNSIFQIDTLIIAPETIYAFDVKNFEGDYYYNSDGFHTMSNNEIQDPLDQLKRMKILLRKLLQSLGYNLPIEGFVVFINPEFTLYQAPLNAPIIFPTQIARFMKKFNQTPSSKLSIAHKNLAEKLISPHKKVPLYDKLPPYSYEKLKKGMNCEKYHSFIHAAEAGKLVCDICGCKENIESAVLRSVEEIRLLFPDKKITTNLVYEWCGGIVSKKQIRRVLKENFKLMGHSYASYYE